jgi:hypothetical protein
MLSLLIAVLAAQEMPKPQKEHAWFKPFVGEWESEAECTAAPGQPAMKMKGTATGRSLGGFWSQFEIRGEMPGGAGSFTGVMTLGWDPRKTAYVGTWTDSCSDYLWTYQGKLDEAGKKLTLETEGPSQETPGAMAPYRETLEWKSADHFEFRSSIQRKGEWVTFLTAQYRRKK